MVATTAKVVTTGITPVAARPAAAAIMFCSAMPKSWKRAGKALLKGAVPVPPATSASSTTKSVRRRPAATRACSKASRSDCICDISRILPHAGARPRGRHHTPSPRSRLRVDDRVPAHPGRRERGIHAAPERVLTAGGEPLFERHPPFVTRPPDRLVADVVLSHEEEDLHREVGVAPHRREPDPLEQAFEALE